MICPTKLLVIGGWLRDRIADKTAGLVDTTGILAREIRIQIIMPRQTPSI